MAKKGTEEMLWVKGGDESSIPLDDEDVWDDTELIRLYDKSIAKLKNKTNSQPDSEKDNNSKKKKKKKKSKAGTTWQVGDNCLALYHHDNLYYEASIISLDKDAKVATVRFSYYLNDEEVNIKDLLRPEVKSKMEVYDPSRLDNNDGHLADAPDVKSDLTDTSDDSAYHGEWHVSDLCYVLSRKGVYHRAVINSFTGADRCVVTFTKSNTKGHAKLSQLHRKLPRDHKRTRSRSSSSPSRLPHLPWSLPELSNMELPPLPPMPTSWALPQFPSANSNSSWTKLFPPGVSFPGTGTAPPPYPAPPPPCPAPPVIGSDVLAGSEEALANMLMSWYISGFHTGYYQGKQQQQQQQQPPQPQPPQQPQTQPTHSFVPPAMPPPVASFLRTSRSDRKKSKRHHDKPKVSNV